MSVVRLVARDGSAFIASSASLANISPILDDAIALAIDGRAPGTADGRLCISLPHAPPAAVAMLLSILDGAGAGSCKEVATSAEDMLGLLDLLTYLDVSVDRAPPTLMRELTLLVRGYCAAVRDKPASACANKGWELLVRMYRFEVSTWAASIRAGRLSVGRLAIGTVVSALPLVGADRMSYTALRAIIDGLARHGLDAHLVLSRVFEMRPMEWAIELGISAEDLCRLCVTFLYTDGALAQLLNTLAMCDLSCADCNQLFEPIRQLPEIRMSGEAAAAMFASAAKRRAPYHAAVAAGSGGRKRKAPHESWWSPLIHPGYRAPGAR